MNRAPREVLFLHSAGPQGPEDGSGPMVAGLRAALGEGYHVSYPKMPRPEAPDYEPWRARIGSLLAAADDGLLIACHSLGGTVLLKHLSEGGAHPRLGGLFLAAMPFWGAKDWRVPVFALAKDFGSRVPRVPIFLYQAGDDEVVSIRHLAMYARRLPEAKVRRLRSGGHAFPGGLPELAEDIRRVAGT